MAPEPLSSDMPLAVSPTPTGDSRRSIFLRFLKFGLLAWGGPAAQIVGGSASLFRAVELRSPASCDLGGR